jgi:hypothetical protein
LEEKTKIHHVEFIVDIDKRRLDDKRLWEPLLPWDYLNLVEGIFKVFGVKGIENITIIYRKEIEGVSNSTNVVPDLKEKSRIE